MKDDNTDLSRKNLLMQYIMLAVVLLVVVAVRIRLLNLPLERDEGEFAYMGQLLLKGFTPFINAYTMKLPGVSIVYAGFMALFGQTAFAIRLGLLLANLLTAALLWMLARRLTGKETASAVAIAYLIMSVSQGVLGVYAHATHYVVLFALTGFLLLLHFLDRQRSLLLLGSGFCFGLAVTMKQHAVMIAAFALLYLLWKGFSAGRPPRSLLLTGTLFVLGALAPVAGLILWLAKAGALHQLWFWTVQYALDYTSEVPLSQALGTFTKQIYIVASPQSLLWIFSVLGLLVLLSRRAETETFFVAGFLCSAFLAVCPGFYFREHYFVMLLPSLALLAGSAAMQLSKLSTKIPLHIVVLGVMVCYGFYHERLYLFMWSPEQVSRSTYGVNPFPESIRIADYINKNSRPGDRLAILGSEPQIYFYADRVSATGHLYLFPLMEDHPNALKMQEEMIREIETAQPAYVVVMSDVYWDMKQQSSRKLRTWADSYISKNYQLAGVTQIHKDRTEYYWEDQVGLCQNTTKLYITVWKRGSRLAAATPSHRDRES